MILLNHHQILRYYTLLELEDCFSPSGVASDAVLY